MSAIAGALTGRNVFSFCNDQDYTAVRNHTGTWSSIASVSGNSGLSGWEGQDADRYAVFACTWGSSNISSDIDSVDTYGGSDTDYFNGTLIDSYEHLTDNGKYLNGFIGYHKVPNSTTALTSRMILDSIKQGHSKYSFMQWLVTGNGSGFDFSVSDKANTSSSSTLTLSLPGSAGDKTIIVACASNNGGSSPSNLSCDVGTRLNQYRENTYCHAQWTAGKIGDATITVTGTFKRFLAMGVVLKAN